MHDAKIAISAAFEPGGEDELIVMVVAASVEIEGNRNKDSCLAVNVGDNLNYNLKRLFSSLIGKMRCGVKLSSSAFVAFFFLLGKSFAITAATGGVS
jgi:hypothetical protein